MGDTEEGKSVRREGGGRTEEGITCTQIGRGGRSVRREGGGRTEEGITCTQIGRGGYKQARGN